MRIYVAGTCKPEPRGKMGIRIYFADLEKGFVRSLNCVGNKQIAELAALHLGLSLAEAGDVVFSNSQYAVYVTRRFYKSHKHKKLVDELRRQRDRKNLKVEWVEYHNNKAWAKWATAKDDLQTPPTMGRVYDDLDKECDAARDRDRT